MTDVGESFFSKTRVANAGVDVERVMDVLVEGVHFTQQRGEVA